MRLQTENRRQSMALAPLDLSRAGLPSLGSPPSSRRASFVPLTGRPGGHRRISSVSDSGIVDFSTSPNSQSLVLPEGPSSRRYSGLYGRTSPSLPEPGQSDLISTEVDGLRRELRTLKDELEYTKHELLESNEAREASETCVKALREFIGENNIGVPGIGGLNSPKLPTPPTMAKGHGEVDGKVGGGVTAWGFKLWKDATLRTPQSATIPPSGLEPLPQVPASATPFSRKLGGFFGSRGGTGSVSSVGSNPCQIDGGPPQLQTNAARSVRESMYSFSDASSVTEPISPPAESNMHGHLVMVRDLSNPGSVGSSPSPLVEVKEIHVHGVESGQPPIVS